MARTKTISNGVKYTVILPESDIQQLKELASKNKIDSVNAGVREAVESYIVHQKNEMYKKDLQEAISDPEFIKRNQDVKDAFKHSDYETERMIMEW